MISIHYTVDENSIANFRHRLKQIERNANRSTRESNAAFKQMLIEIEDYLRTNWRANFNQGGGMYGPWEELDPDTLEAKRGRGSALVFTGKMRGKFFSAMYPKRKARGMDFHFRNYRGLTFHHFGTNHEPRRPLVGINATDEAAVIAIIERNARKFVHIAWQQG